MGDAAQHRAPSTERVKGCCSLPYSNPITMHYSTEQGVHCLALFFFLSPRSVSLRRATPNFPATHHPCFIMLESETCQARFLLKLKVEPLWAGCRWAHMNSRS